MCAHAMRTVQFVFTDFVGMSAEDLYNILEELWEVTLNRIVMHIVAASEGSSFFPAFVCDEDMRQWYAEAEAELEVSYSCTSGSEMHFN